MVRLAFVVVACAVALAGCQAPVQEMSYSDVRLLAREVNDRCEAQGFKYETPEGKQCFDHEARREIATRENNQIRLRQGAGAVAAGLQGASQGFYRASATPIYTPPMTCTSTRTPSGSYTTRC